MNERRRRSEELSGTVAVTCAAAPELKLRHFFEDSLHALVVLPVLSSNIPLVLLETSMELGGTDGEERETLSPFFEFFWQLLRPK
jgi:hypothetical protein